MANKSTLKQIACLVNFWLYVWQFFSYIRPGLEKKEYFSKKKKTTLSHIHLFWDKLN